MEIQWGFQIRFWSLPQMTFWTTKFVIMICCKINFDMIWYSVIYLSIFVWSSDILNFRFYECCHSCLCYNAVVPICHTINFIYEALKLVLIWRNNLWFHNQSLKFHKNLVHHFCMKSIFIDALQIWKKYFLHKIMRYIYTIDKHA